MYSSPSASPAGSYSSSGSAYAQSAAATPASWAASSQYTSPPTVSSAGTWSTMPYSSFVSGGYS
ncbi:hypothetical protein SERLADRAFT_376055, partial [Serpula lacrymans var. lacrymans S7.9]